MDTVSDRDIREVNNQVLSNLDADVGEKLRGLLEALMKNPHLGKSDPPIGKSDPPIGRSDTSPSIPLDDIMSGVNTKRRAFRTRNVVELIDKQLNADPIQPTQMKVHVLHLGGVTPEKLREIGVGIRRQLERAPLESVIPLVCEDGMRVALVQFGEDVSRVLAAARSSSLLTEKQALVDRIIDSLQLVDPNQQRLF